MTGLIHARRHVAPPPGIRKRQLFLCLLTSLMTLHMPSQAVAAEAAYEGFQSPVGIASIPGKAVYVSDWSANTVTRIDQNGTRTVVAKDIPAAAGVAIDQKGALFIASYSADYIVRLDSDGSVRRIAENLSTPTGITFSRDGRLLVANRGAGQVVSVDVSSGRASLVADGFSLPVGVVEMEDSSIVVSQYGGRVTRVTRDGHKQELGTSFNRPEWGLQRTGRMPSSWWTTVLALFAGSRLTERHPSLERSYPVAPLRLVEVWRMNGLPGRGERGPSIVYGRSQSA